MVARRHLHTQTHPKFKKWTFGPQLRHAEIAGSLPDFYLAPKRVSGSNQSVSAGGLRPGGLLPLRTLAGGVGASLQEKRKQVESGERRNAARCSGSSGLLSLQGGWRKLHACLRISEESVEELSLWNVLLTPDRKHLACAQSFSGVTALRWGSSVYCFILMDHNIHVQTEALRWKCYLPI